MVSSNLRSLQPRAIEALEEYIEERRVVRYRTLAQAVEITDIRQGQGALDELSKLFDILQHLKGNAVEPK